MAACNQTDIPVLNIQEDPCIQGSLSTNCIFYGLAIAYLGTQDNTNFAGTLGYIVAKLEAGNNIATDLEEINRAQSLLIEELQNSVAESLVTLSEVQSLLDECCPEPTTSTTTVAPTTTTTNSTTTTTSNGINYVFFSSGNNPTEACNSSNFVSLYWAGNSDPNGKQVFIDPNLTQGYYTLGSLATNGNVYSSSNGYLFLQGSCSSYTTTTIPPTTTTTVPTTTNPVAYSFTVKVLNEGERPCDGPYTTVYTATPYLAGGTFVYSDSGLTTPVTDGLVIWVAQADYYTGSSIYNNGQVYSFNRIVSDCITTTLAPTTTTTTTTVPVGLTCPEGFPNRTTGNGTMTLSNGVTLTTTYTGPALLSGSFNPPFTVCGNSFKGNDGAGGTMYLNYTGGAFTLTLTFSQPQSHIAFGISGMGIYNQQGVTESYTFTTNGGSTQITELNGCGNFQVQGFNTLVGSNNDGTASDGSGAIQVTSSGLFTEVTITGNNPGSLNGVGIDLYLCSNLILQ